MIGAVSSVKSTKSSVAGTSHVIASVPMIAGAYYVLGAIIKRASAVPTNPTVSGPASGAWSTIVGNTFSSIASARYRLVTRGFFCTTPGGLTENITLDYGGVSNDGYEVIVVEVPGGLATGPVQAPAAVRSDAATTLTVPLNVFASQSIALGFFALDKAVPAFAPAAGFSLIDTVTDNTLIASLTAIVQAADADPSETSFTSGGCCAVGLEIGAEPVVAGTAALYRTRRRVRH